MREKKSKTQNQSCALKKSAQKKTKKKLPINEIPVYGSITKTYSIKELLGSFLEDLEQDYNGKNNSKKMPCKPAFKSGISAIDKNIEGIPGGGLTVLLGQSPDELEAFCVFLLSECVKQKTKAVFFSLYNRAKSVVRSLLSSCANVYVGVPQGLSADSLQKIQDASGLLYESGIEVVETSIMSASDLQERIERAASDGVKVFFVNSLNSVYFDNPLESRKDPARILYELHFLAKELGVCVFASFVEPEFDKTSQGGQSPARQYVRSLMESFSLYLSLDFVDCSPESDYNDYELQAFSPLLNQAFSGLIKRKGSRFWDD